VALLPDLGAANDATTLSKKLGRQGEVYFILNGCLAHPHVTLYSPEYPQVNYNRVISSVKSIAKQTSKIIAEPGRIKTNGGYVWLEILKTRSIKKLHEAVVVKLNPLRKGHLREKYQDPEILDQLSSKQKKNIANFGYPNVLNLYDPHLTITRFKDPKLATKLVKNLRWKKIFVFNKIGVFTTGKYGTCKKLLHSFKLEK